ncbi:hypothetical protein [Pseudomonas japonica]|uniref:hypothetical protein n=1 Tax=Pseudomonas japonica TaxID=256466 RepID=UPI0015E2B231|nr:hypothetical protein [Pseudomonas japonica]MBA1245919.1 hypothetical protein [Pseudomonas japonica]
MEQNLQAFQAMPVDHAEISNEVSADLVVQPLGIGDDWILMLINMTDRLLTLQRIKLGSNSWGGWTAMAPIGRTCNLNSPQVCFDEQRYSPVMTIGCGGAAFSIELRDADGYGAAWDGIVSNCQHAGGVITLG